MPKAEPLPTTVHFTRRHEGLTLPDGVPVDERWEAHVMLGPVEIGLGVAATPDEAERQARADAKARLHATADQIGGA